MATRNMQVLVDDLDDSVLGEGEGRTIALVLDGERVDLDLSLEHVNELKEALDPYFRAGRGKGLTDRPVQRRTVSQPTQPRPAGAQKGLGEIREWAKKQGYKVSERGRIPYSVMDAYAKSHMTR